MKQLINQLFVRKLQTSHTVATTNVEKPMTTLGCMCHSTRMRSTPLPSSIRRRKPRNDADSATTEPLGVLPRVRRLQLHHCRRRRLRARQFICRWNNETSADDAGRPAGRHWPLRRSASHLQRSRSRSSITSSCADSILKAASVTDRQTDRRPQRQRQPLLAWLLSLCRAALPPPLLAKLSQ